MDIFKRRLQLVAALTRSEKIQVALLSQTGRAMLRVCQELASVVQNVEESFYC